MSALVDVSCQHCGRKKIGRILSGVSEFKCSGTKGCKRVSLVGRTPTGVLRYLRVDKPVAA